MLTNNGEDIFIAEKMPGLVKELSIIKNGIINMPRYFKSEIIISYFKNHCIKNDWIKANPELVKLLLSGCFITKNIEAQFDFYRAKPSYMTGYETYIQQHC